MRRWTRSQGCCHTMSAPGSSGAPKPVRKPRMNARRASRAVAVALGAYPTIPRSDDNKDAVIAPISRQHEVEDLARRVDVGGRRYAQVSAILKLALSWGETFNDRYWPASREPQRSMTSRGYEP